jgi:hypothetical protein
VEDEVNEDDWQQKAWTRRGSEKKDLLGAAMLGVCAFLLLFLALTPLFDWASVSVTLPRGLQEFGLQGVVEKVQGSELVGNLTNAAIIFGSRNNGKAAGRELIHDWRGKLILAGSLLTALLTWGGLAAVLAMGRRRGDALAGVSASIAAGWAMAMLLLLIGAIWRILATPTIELLVAKVSVSPRVVVYLGAFAALGVLGASVPVALSRRQALWLLLALGVGFALGVVWVAVDVQPWKAVHQTKGLFG